MCLRALPCLGFLAHWKMAKGHCPGKLQLWVASQSCMVTDTGVVEERPFWNGKMDRGRVCLFVCFFPVVLGQLRNFGGSNLCTFYSLLRLWQLQFVKHFTSKPIWEPASFAEAFTPPGDSAEQEHRDRPCSQQRPHTDLLQPTSTQTAPPYTHKAGGLGHTTFTKHPFRSLAQETT